MVCVKKNRNAETMLFIVGVGEFLSPITYDAIAIQSIDAILLPGGHAQGMKPYLESKCLQALIAEHFSTQKPIAAICHGVVLAARRLR